MTCDIPNGARLLNISIHTSAREVTDGIKNTFTTIWISIHTSTREVTGYSSYRLDYVLISIHTSTREVTADKKIHKPDSKFQSTLPQGKWPCMAAIKDFGIKFQSTLPQGKWLSPSDFNCPQYIFQSTLPQGKWRNGYHGKPADCYFNPHFHKGSDLTIYAQHDFKLISIHTSTREVTLGDYCDMYNGDNFNPHFHKGSDRRLYLTSLICINFNPHFHKGSDGMAGTWPDRICYFNPHFHKGSDCNTLNTGGLLYISIHTSTREVTGISSDISVFFNGYFNPHFHKGSDSNIPQKHLSIFMKYL